MSDNSSSDAIALRREARRRKILENAENRMRIITGKVSSTSHIGSNSDNIFYGLQNDVENENEFDNNSQEIFTEKNFLKEFSGLNESFQYDSDEEIKYKRRTRMNNSYFELIIQKRFHYIVLSVIIYILLFFELGFTFYNNIFCPFITVKLMEYILVQSAEPYKSDLLSLVVPSSSKRNVITFIFKTYSIVANIFSDFFLYIFIFILSDKLFHIISQHNNL